MEGLTTASQAGNQETTMVGAIGSCFDLDRRGRMHQHRAGGKETTIPAIAVDYGYLNERDDLLQEAAVSVTVIVGSASDATLSTRWSWLRRQQNFSGCHSGERVEKMVGFRELDTLKWFARSVDVSEEHNVVVVECHTFDR